jgi:hypothetical protein
MSASSIYISHQRDQVHGVKGHNNRSGAWWCEVQLGGSFVRLRSFQMFQTHGVLSNRSRHSGVQLGRRASLDQIVGVSNLSTTCHFYRKRGSRLTSPCRTAETREQQPSEIISTQYKNEKRNPGWMFTVTYGKRRVQKLERAFPQSTRFSANRRPGLACCTTGQERANGIYLNMSPTFSLMRLRSEVHSTAGVNLRERGFSLVRDHPKFHSSFTTQRTCICIYRSHVMLRNKICMMKVN